MLKPVESVIILRLLNSYLQNNFKTLALAIPKNEAAKDWLFIMVRYITVIQVVSFIDEYDKHLGKADDSNISLKLLQAKKIAQPAIKRVRKWTGMRHLRNSILAHNLRDRKDNNSFAFNKSFLKDSAIPNDITEFEVLVKCIDIITQIITQPVLQHVNEYNSIEDSKKDERVIDTRIDPEKEMRHIMLEISNIYKSIHY